MEKKGSANGPTMPVALHKERKVPVFAYLANKSEGPFQCPHCGEAVLLRRGKFTVAHFAHIGSTSIAKNKQCSESLAHYTAKVILVRFLHKFIFVGQCVTCPTSHETSSFRFLHTQHGSVSRTVDISGERRSDASLPPLPPLPSTPHTDIADRHFVDVERGLKCGEKRYKLDVAVLKDGVGGGQLTPDELQVVAGIEVHHTHAVDAAKMQQCRAYFKAVHGHFAEVRAEDVKSIFTDPDESHGGVFRLYFYDSCQPDTLEGSEVQLVSRKRSLLDLREPCSGCATWTLRSKLWPVHPPMDIHLENITQQLPQPCRTGMIGDFDQNARRAVDTSSHILSLCGYSSMGQAFALACKFCARRCPQCAVLCTRQELAQFGKCPSCTQDEKAFNAVSASQK